jgi:hypothetical protein
MIHEWTTENGNQNFGDALYTLIYSEIFLDQSTKSETHVYFLIGSLICDDILDYASYLGKIPVFIHCGWNGKMLTKEKAKNAVFIG